MKFTECVDYVAEIIAEFFQNFNRVDFVTMTLVGTSLENYFVVSLKFNRRIVLSVITYI